MGFEGLAVVMPSNKLEQCVSEVKCAVSAAMEEAEIISSVKE